jgi:peptidoglycan hydrolase CwlO-like protein
MKTFFILVILFSLVGLAQAQTQVLSSEPINVDGFVTEQVPTDGELQGIHAELERQKKEIVLNREKVKTYKELNKSVEKLSETAEDYIEEKKAAQKEIAEYNAKVRCMQQDNPGPECNKYLRRRH